MSKKKGQEKKEIVAAFVPGYFWEYKIGTPENAEKANTFINTFQNELKALVDPAKSFQQNYKILAQKMGVNVHPSLQVNTKQQSNFPTLKNNDYGQKFVVFLSYKIDIVTLKLFGFLISQYKLNSLKLSNNNFDVQQVNELVRIFEKEDALTSLYFEWNPLENCENRKDIILATARPSLNHLLLRDCKMGNEIFKELIIKIKNHPEEKIKSLDLYGNQLTNDVMQDICKFVQESKTIEFLGISRNALNSQEFISKLFNSIGQIPLSEQQYQEHKQKEKLRDEIIEKNKKRKKGAPQEPIPFVFDVKQTPDGRFYVKNTSLKTLNISSNGLTDNLVPLIRNFAQKQGKNIELFVEGNKFSKKSKQTLKFFDNVIL